MGCSSCGSGSPAGCQNNGHCTSGTCNRMNTYDWISVLDYDDPTAYQFIEVSFKKGARKEFAYINPQHKVITGDMVLVDVQGGYDIGRVSLSGELVRLQMRKKNTPESKVTYKIIRKANTRDLERLEELRSKEKKALITARVIARTMGLDMKMGDVEYRGDGKKATFYYTARGRVDFRELVRSYAKEFRVKIEMRQIGTRQESGRIGGVGSCGRELCCSTWLSDFKSVNTNAARYQNISINQTKLSGQCGRLKCCLNYELDTYLDALDSFPKNPEILKTKKGNANLIKMDIFKGLLFYNYEDPKHRGQIITLTKEDVKLIKDQNKNNQIPDELVDLSLREVIKPKENDKDDDYFDEDIDMIDTFEEIELPSEKRRGNRSKKRRNNRNRNSRNNRSNNRKTNNQNKSGANQKSDKAANTNQKSNKRKKFFKKNNKQNSNNNNKN